MGHEIALPQQFTELQGQVRYVVRRGMDQYSGSCPACGGDLHSNGEFPDRFVMMLNSRATGGPLGWCRHCGFKWWPGKGKGKDWKPTPEQEQAWLDERKQTEQQRLSTVTHALQLLTKEQAWIGYHNSLNGEIRQLYEARGIPEYWQDEWQLGYCPAKQIYDFGSKTHYITPTLTIPIFETITHAPLTIRHRLLNPVNPGDKYRPEIKDLPASLFTCNLEMDYTENVLVIEGEFKAMVVYITLDSVHWQVVGLPGKSPNPELLQKLTQAKRLVICLDPDATIPDKSGRTALQRVGDILPNARAIYLPEKIDDLIIRNAINKTILQRLILGARSIQRRANENTHAQQKT